MEHIQLYIQLVSVQCFFFWGGGRGWGSRGDICKSGRRHVRHPIQLTLVSLTKEILKTGGTYHMSRLTNFILTKLLMKKVGIRKEV